MIVRQDPSSQVRRLAGLKRTEPYIGELQLKLQLELDQRDAFRRRLIHRRQGRFAAPVRRPIAVLSVRAITRSQIS